MLRPQHMNAFISSAGIPVVPQTAQLPSLNTKTEIGKSLATWPKLELHTVPLPLDILQWLWVVILVEHRKWYSSTVL